MGIALSLQEYLKDHHINYEVMTHERTGSSLQTARRSVEPMNTAVPSHQQTFGYL
jgi:hypothetical protein